MRLIAISVPIVAALLYFGTVSRRGAETPPVAEPTPGDAPAGAVAAPVAPPPIEAPPAVSTPPPVAAAPPSGSAPQPRPAAAATTSTGLSPAGASDPSERVTVAVVATGPCWVSAIVDGERVVAREFQTGERIAFEFGRSVVLTAGDAAALAVTINGEEARPLGTAGQVVTVRVTPTNFKEYLVAP
jgi:hypothetical protein